MTGILLALQGGRKTASQLGERFEVSRRTILRDIEALSQVGVPVVALPGSGGGYELAEGFWLPPLHLTTDEASLLLLALQRFGAVEASPFGPARLTVEEKLRSVLPVPVIRDAERLNSAISVESPHRWERLGHFRAIQLAALNRRWLRVGYQSARRVADHDLLPLRLFEDAGRWYMAAFSGDASEERVFRIDRIQTLTQIPTPSDSLDLHPSPDEGGASELIEVEARVTYAACRRLEDHPDFVGDLVEDHDGGWLRFVTPASELDYFARELFALGPEVDVREPAALRARVFDLAMATIGRYVAANGDTTVSPIEP